MSRQRRVGYVHIENGTGYPVDTRVLLRLPGKDEGAYDEIDLTSMLLIESVSIDADAREIPRATIRLVDVTFDVLAEADTADARVQAQLGLTQEGWKALRRKIKGETAA